MNLYTHLEHTKMMSASLESPESARRREQLLWSSRRHASCASAGGASSPGEHGRC